MADVLTILSNFVFLVPAVKAFQLHRWTRGMIFLCIIVFSSLYHTCNSFEGACLFDAELHRKLDFFFAQFVIPATALYIIIFPKKWQFLERILLILFAIVIVIVQVTAGEVFYAQLLITAVAFAFMAAYWIGYCIWAHRTGQDHYFPPYEWECFTWGIALTGISASLYATELQNHTLYWAVHSCWHSLAAIGQYFILCIRPGADRYANMDRMIAEKGVSNWARRKMIFVHQTPASKY
jgi:hypothetical protein